jgi:hypothetical protein
MAIPPQGCFPLLALGTSVALGDTPVALDGMVRADAGVSAATLEASTAAGAAGVTFERAAT